MRQVFFSIEVVSRRDISLEILFKIVNLVVGTTWDVYYLKMCEHL